MMLSERKAFEEAVAEANARAIPAAQAFPIPTGKRWDEFFASIRDDGQKLPIILDVEDRIVDGRCRWIACKLLGREPKTERRNLTRLEAINEVIDGNIRRRHEKAGAIAIELAKLRQMLKAAAKDQPENFPVPSQAELAIAGGIDERTVRDAEHLLEEHSALADEVSGSNGKLSLHGARTLARQDDATRDEALNKIKGAATGQDVKAIIRSARAPKGKKPTEELAHAPASPGTKRSAGLEFTGQYAAILSTIDDLKSLTHDLRNLHKLVDVHPLEALQVKEMRKSIEAVTQIDFEKLNAAAQAAMRYLDNLSDDHSGQNEAA